MYDNQIKTATRQANTALILAFFCFTLLGVALGVLFNPAIVNFIELISKTLKQWNVISIF